MSLITSKTIMLREQLANMKKHMQVVKDKLYQDPHMNDSQLKKIAYEREGFAILGKEGYGISERRTLSGHFNMVLGVHWSSDGRMVSVGKDQKMIIWDPVQKGKKLGVITVKSTLNMFCAFEETIGDMIMCGGLGNMIDIYRLEHESSNNANESGEGAVIDKNDKIRNACDIVTLAGHEGYVSCARFLNRNQVLSSSGDGLCKIWDIERGMCLGNYEAHGYCHDNNKGARMGGPLENAIMELCVSPTDPNAFITGSIDNTCRLWDVRTGNSTHCFDQHTSDVNTVKYMPNGITFASGSDDSSMKLYDLRAYQELNTYQSEFINAPCNSLDMSSSGRLIFGAHSCAEGDSPANKLVCYDVCSGLSDRPMVLSSGRNVRCVSVNHSRGVSTAGHVGGSCLAAPGYDHKIKLYS